MRILSRLASTDDVRNHALSQRRTGSTKQLVIVVTSDKGLAGSVNSAVLKQVERLKTDGVEFDMVAIGRKAVEFASREGITCLAEYTNVHDGVTVSDVYAMAEVALGAFTKDTTYSTISIVYQNFISTFEQEPTKRQILPLDPAEVHFIMRGIRPKTGKFSDDVAGPDAVTQYSVEPDAASVLDVLIPQLVQVLIFHALLESKASEHSARMVAMKNATDKSKEVIKSLTIKYNKARQAKITAEISEITAGAAAME
jgi:F-type H+-transporting ATPase subunit gamma